MSNCEDNSQCTPCYTQVSTKESLASELDNLTNSLFGTFTKTIVNGRAVWSAICSSNDEGLSCFPRAVDEGFICYILRILDEIGLFSASIHNPAVSYCKNTLVASGDSLYVALQDVPPGTLISNTSYWLLLLTAPAGATGPQGPAGASGGSNTPAYAIRTTAISITPANTDDVIFCEPGGAIAINLSAIASYASGKRFKIWTNGAANVTVTPNGAETINGSASYVLNTPYQSIEIVANGSTDWRIF